MSDDSIFSDKAWLAEGRRNRSHDPQKVSPQVIPAEAVEAAAKAIASANLRSKSWDALNEEARNHFLRDARAAFEAAAPYMLAGAWEQGWDSFASFDSRPGGPYPTNPYMLNNEGEK